VIAINPDCRVHSHQAFFLKSNADALLSVRFSAVVDAIDSPSLKSLLIARCRAAGLPVVTTGAAGGRRDPAAIEIADLASTSHDRLLLFVRRILRRRYGFPRGDKLFGVECVVSREPVLYPTRDGSVCAQRSADPDLRLDCDTGYGTACFVTGAFGFLAASRAVHAIVTGPNESSTTPEASPTVQASN